MTMVYAAPFMEDRITRPETSKDLADRLTLLEQQIRELQKQQIQPPPISMNQQGALIAAWRKDKGFTTNWHNVPEKLMLVVTELAEAMEAYRHLPEDAINWLDSAAAAAGYLPPPERAKEWVTWWSNFREEIADTLIRLLDLTSSLNIDADYEVDAKMEKNKGRPHMHGKER